MMLNSYLPNRYRRYAFAGLALGAMIPLAALAGGFSVGAGPVEAARDFSASPFGWTAIAAPVALACLLGWLGRRQMRFARAIRAERAATDRLRQAAYHDSLTGLRNRHALSEDAGDILGREDCCPASLALLLFDLDDFKFINDTMGHAAGDEVLKAISSRLDSFGCDNRRTYRLGGDEFVILWEGAPGKAGISEFCETLAATVFRPVDSCNGVIDTAGSIGITVTDNRKSTLSELLKRADLALYRAKETPGRSHCFFTGDMDHDHRLRRSMEITMREGIAAGAYRLEYHPVIDATSLSPSGFAVRLRWRHPVYGDVAREIFLRMAEESGLIVLLGKWMLKRALGAATSWRSQAEITLPLSAAQLRDRGLAASTLEALVDAGWAPQRLIFDICPGAAISQCKIALSNIEALRAAGVRIAVSEFAAGIAGLSMARTYEVDRIRLDLDHIKAIAGESRTQHMLGLFLQLASTVGTPVSLTGVDSERDFRIACAAAAPEVEGRYVGAGLSGAEAGHYLAALNSRASADCESGALRKAG